MIFHTELAECMTMVIVTLLGCGRPPRMDGSLGRVWSSIGIALIAWLLAGAVRAQTAYDFGGYPGYTGPTYRGYTTRSLYVRAQDGTKLAIDVHLPKRLEPGTRVPTVMKVTRYWRAVSLRWPASLFDRDDFTDFFTSQGYAVVKMDVRGTGASFGSWPISYTPQEAQDAGRDVVQWIVEQPWSNGKVGGQGISYPGNTAALLPLANHPAVKAVVPRFIEFDEYTDLPFPGGICNAGFLQLWQEGNRALDTNDLATLIELDGGGLFARLMLRGVKPVDGDPKRLLLRAAIADHQHNGNVFALAESVTYRDDIPTGFDVNIDGISLHSYREDAERSGAAYYLWGSWMDAATSNAVLHHFFTYENPQRAVIGAWSHGGRRDSDPFRPTDSPLWPSKQDQMLDSLRFLDHYLKGVENGVMSEKVLHYYTMGEQKWKTTSVWPPEGTTMERWYLADGRTLSRAPPRSLEGADRYAVDFTATSGTSNRWYTQLGGSDVVYDERAAQLSKTLSYRSEPLAGALEITGHAVVTLRIRSTHTEGALYAYLDAEAPDGRIVYITDGQLRALHRKVSDAEPPYRIWVPYHTFQRADALPMTSGAVEEVSFGLLPTSALIPAGYRLRVSIAGADSDNFTRYPAEGDPVLTVERNAVHVSWIDLPVVGRP
jgi:putative CocE/NonD family hydrolase